MNAEEANAMLESLKNGEVADIFVSKDDFLSFREVIVSREDFKYFRGIAQRGGNVIYQYMAEPRS
jgi:hypothetical protein